MAEGVVRHRAAVSRIGVRVNHNLWLLAFSGVPEGKAPCHHQAAEELAHGEGSQEKTDLWIRFSEEFDNEPEHAITTKKKGEHGAMWPGVTFF